MPNRLYRCHSCEDSFETFQSIHDPILTECKCGGKLWQDLSGISFCMNEPKTLGALADKNAQKLGESGVRLAEQRRQNIENENQRRKAREISEKTGLECIAPCDRKKPKINGKEFKPLDKATQKKIFSGNKKEVKKKVQKFVKDGEV